MKDDHEIELVLDSVDSDFMYYHFDNPKEKAEELITDIKNIPGLEGRVDARIEWNGHWGRVWLTVYAPLDEENTDGN